jgi:nucleoside-diphosphate-sugar epimerase
MPGLVYGPGDKSGVHEMWVSYLRGRLPMVPKKTAFCWGHVEDIARGHIQAMEQGKPGESYILAGPQHTLIEAFEIARTITGIKPPRFHPGPHTMQFFSALMGVVGYVKPLSEAYTGEGLRSVAGKTYLGIDQKARLELDFLPRSLEAGLRETLAFEQAELKRDTSEYDNVTPEQFHKERMQDVTNTMTLVKSKIKTRKSK